MSDMDELHAEEFEGELQRLMVQEPVQFAIPLRLLGALNRYRYQHIPTGDFLRAVLENNLKEAVGRADTESQLALCAIVSWCYNNMPAIAWGSPEKVEQWLKNS